MKKTNGNKSESGQVLVMLALAMVAIIAIAALAIDGANAYSNRRHAQNAADAAAFAGALVKAEKGSLTQVKNAALARAASNSFVDNDPADNGAPIDVIVNIPPVDGPHAGDSSYVQVKIRATTDTFLAKIIGVDTMTSLVSAIAIGVPTDTSDLFNGSAMLALNQHACGALSFTGASKTYIQKGGLFSNSDCNEGGPKMGFYLNNDVEAPWVETVGGAYLHDTLTLTASNGVQAGVSPIPYPPPINWPTKELDAACAKLPNQSDNSGTPLNPGNYAGFSPNTNVTLNSGIYCITSGDMSIQHNVTGTNVLFYVKTGKVTINGGTVFNVTGYDKDPFKGLLIYTPMENHSAVTINGGSNSSFTGTIMSPGSQVTLSGGGNSNGFKSQVIGDTITVTGTQSLYLNYDASQNYMPKQLPYLQLTQ